MRLQAVNSGPREIQLRGRSLLALVLTPEPPLADWIAQLDAHLASAASGLMEQRPVIVDLSCAAEEGREMIVILLEGLEARGLRIVGVERAGATILAGTAWARLAAGLPGRELAAPAPPRGPAAQPSQLVEGPVRSGQTLVFEGGDVTIVGAVASGAEVVAGGSIHIYGALRGRAIAGLRPGVQARIFCSRLEAEMVGVGRLYRTADHWGAALHGRAAQVWSDRGTLRLARLDRR